MTGTVRGARGRGRQEPATGTVTGARNKGSGEKSTSESGQDWTFQSYRGLID